MRLMAYMICASVATTVGDVAGVVPVDYRLCADVRTQVGDPSLGPDGPRVPYDLRVCGDIRTHVGPIPHPDGVWEDWCDFPGKWTDLIAESFDPDRNVASAACAPFGGRLSSDGNPEEFPQFFLQLGPGKLNMQGRWLAWKMAPMRGDAQLTQIELYGKPNGDQYALIEILDDDGTEVMDLWLFDFGENTDDYARLTYDPEEHAWVRVVHDDVANQMRIETAAPCGTWTTRVEIAVAASVPDLADMYLTLFMGVGTGTPPHVIDEQGYIGTMIIGTTNP
jgi:hypothetical protein